MMKRSTLPRLGVHWSRALVSVTLVTLRCVGGAGTAEQRKIHCTTVLIHEDIKITEYAHLTVDLWS